MKKVAPIELTHKARMSTAEADTLALQIANEGLSVQFKVRTTSSGYVPVSGSRRLEIALAASSSVIVQDIESGESFEVSLNADGVIVRA